MTTRPRAARRLTVTCVALAALATGLAAAPTAMATAAPGAPASHDSRDTRDATAVRALLATLPDGVTDAAVVRVSGRGMHGPYTGTAGEVQANGRVPVGSVTKVFTDAMVLQLVAEHRIGIDEPVRRYLPEVLPAAYGDVTVRQLLDHTSDLPRPARVPLDPRGVVAASFAADAADRPGRVPAPGTVQQYNGLNSFVAGLLVEEVTGRSYAHELDRRILRPLALRHTGLSDEPAIAWAWSEGGLTSTPGDLDAFLKALLGGRLLAPAQQRHLFEVPAVPGAPENTSCPTGTACFSAGGLMGIELNGTKIWGKTGSSGGWTSGVFATTDHRRRTVYTLRPNPLATPQQQRTRIEAVVEAALTN
ncbi:serine hydrolase domain-containing protein [Streptomyces sp. NRRL F-5727]|uniref:serine hydrolase domain-containing protein n=1 Tax=Streptomyces sp. NRRL F-5727 TaxID=1463871 RepID=UPI00068BB7C5|nr:serine hydrolase domain-containing protein [Streptomyces sp. NRRL F-5727]